jgi:CBS domain-containing protein
LTDIRQLLADADALRGLVRAADLGERTVVTAFPDEDLEVVLERMERHDFGNVPIVERGDSGLLLGVVTHQAVLDCYARASANPGLLATVEQ